MPCPHRNPSHNRSHSHCCSPSPNRSLNQSPSLTQSAIPGPSLVESNAKKDRMPRIGKSKKIIVDLTR